MIDSIANYMEKEQSPNFLTVAIKEFVNFTIKHSDNKYKKVILYRIQMRTAVQVNNGKIKIGPGFLLNKKPLKSHFSDKPSLSFVSSAAILLSLVLYLPTTNCYIAYQQL